MKSVTLRLGLLFVLFAIGKSIACGIDWQVPKNHFDGVNEWGQLSYWREIGSIDLGSNLKVPVVIGFNPVRGTSPYLGKGWIIPLLESKIVQIDEKKFLLTQPDGILRQFWRKSSNDNFLKGQGNWKGQIEDSKITLWAECGWKLIFIKGSISSIVTPQNQTLSFVHSGGKTSGIQKNGNTVLKIQADPQNGTSEQLFFSGHEVSIELANMPLVSIVPGSQAKVIGGFQKSLHKLTFPDGTQALYEFSVSDKLQPSLAITGDDNRSFIWDSATGSLRGCEKSQRRLDLASLRAMRAEEAM